MTHTASLLTPVRMSLEEYLPTSFRPDMELVGGELKEKAVVAPMHGRTQILIGAWFERHEDDWKIQSMVEVCTQVSGENVRLPDIPIAADLPLPKSSVCSAADRHRGSSSLGHVCRA